MRLYPVVGVGSTRTDNREQIMACRPFMRGEQDALN